MKVIISTGGTGGHIFPAIAVADEIRRRDPASDILFVGALDRMEMQKVPNAGYEIIGLPVQGFLRKTDLRNLKRAYKFGISLFKSRRILRQFKPNLIIGFGAFASAPILMASYFSSIPRFIHEQNAFPGVVNRMMASSVRKIFAAYESVFRFFPKEKVMIVGNPVRKESQTFDRSQALQHFELEEDKKIVLITGGSLGARTLNESILQNLTVIQDRKDVQWILQCGDRYFKEINANHTNLPDNLIVRPFIDKMAWAIQLSDLVCARAGALTVSELAYYEKASILIPSPNVAEDHQMKNAQALEEVRACRIVKDTDSIKKLTGEILTLLDEEQELEALSMNVKQFSSTDAQKKIVDELLNIVRDEK